MVGKEGKRNGKAQGRKCEKNIFKLGGALMSPAVRNKTDGRKQEKQRAKEREGSGRR